MRIRRGLFSGVVSVAAVLVAGRLGSAVLADYTWYTAMGASALWSERAADLILLYFVGSLTALAVAFINFSALGRSIGTLALPRRISNVEFGEAVPRKYLDRVAFALAVAVTAAVTPALPSWTSLALAKLGVSFRESDPYFQHDLAFYTTWLPFEKAVYTWAMLLLVGVSFLVVLLYSLTPGLRWDRAGLRMSAHVRRHLSALAALLLLITMWSYRLESYDLMTRAGAAGRFFSYVEHQWLLPGLLLLSIATAAAAITVLLSGWAGQLRTSFVAVTVVVILSVAVQEVVPFVVRRLTPRDTEVARERPYRATRNDFTRRAYAINAATDDALRTSVMSSVMDSTVANPGGQQLLREDSLVYPGATGLVVVSDPRLDIAGQRIGGALSRFAFAWAYQSFDLLSDSVSRRARVVTLRDVRNRVLHLAPVLAQGSMVEAMFHADTLYWKLELYSASSNYPLSEHFVLAGEERSYFRHAATALVNARTARVMFAPDQNRDPISQAWMSAFPNSADSHAPAIARELVTTPWQPVSTGSATVAGDSAFRSAVSRFYNRMRAALAAGDLKAFATFYDSLGALIAAPRK